MDKKEQIQEALNRFFLQKKIDETKVKNFSIKIIDLFTKEDKFNFIEIIYIFMGALKYLAYFNNEEVFKQFQSLKNKEDLWDSFYLEFMQNIWNEINIHKKNNL